MQPDPDRKQIACDGKAQLTFGRARSAAKAMRNKDKGKVDPYHCPHCGYWHVGSRTARLPDRRKEFHGKKDEEGEAGCT